MTMSTMALEANSKVSAAAFSTQGSDVASKCAAALNMDKAAFLELGVEQGWESGTSDGAVALYYSYQELVRRNFTKEYLDLAKSELEKYLCDAEFAVVFLKSKVLLDTSVLFDLCILIVFLRDRSNSSSSRGGSRWSRRRRPCSSSRLPLPCGRSFSCSL